MVAVDTVIGTDISLESEVVMDVLIQNSMNFRVFGEITQIKGILKDGVVNLLDTILKNIPIVKGFYGMGTIV